MIVIYSLIDLQIINAKLQCIDYILIQMKLKYIFQNCVSQSFRRINIKEKNICNKIF